MEYCISVKFEESQKSYYFKTDDESIDLGDFVVVETIIGKELGKVISHKQDLASLNFDKEIKPILRRATKKDSQTYKENKEAAKKAAENFEKFTKELNLDMRLIKTEYTLDKEKVLFTYFSEERIDFRELLKRLAALLKCRIELRQITARERAMLVGGYGVCGLPLCCTYMYSNQEGISLSKAKNQMLTINIPKLSGVCGKLLCCLKYEDDFYTEAKKSFPPINTTFVYNGDTYKISSYNVMSKIIKCVSQDNVEFFPLSDVLKLVKQSGKYPQKKQNNNQQKQNNNKANQNQGNKNA